MIDKDALIEYLKDINEEYKSYNCASGRVINLEIGRLIADIELGVFDVEED